MLSVLLGDLLIEPWYTRPADAAANALAVLLTSIAASGAEFNVSSETFDAGRGACILISGSVLVLAVLAMLTRRPAPAQQHLLHRTAFALAGTLGRARFLYSAFFAIAAAGAFASSTSDLLIVYLLGSLVVWARPAEDIVARLSPRSKEGSTIEAIVTDVAQPRTAFLTVRRSSGASIGAPVLRHGSRLGRIVWVSEIDDPMTVETSLDDGGEVRVGDSLQIGTLDDVGQRIVGPASRQTSLDRVVVRGSGTRFDEVGLDEGALIEASVRSRPVLYQVIGAEIESAQPEASARSKRVRIVARKLGEWDAGVGTFSTSGWIPEPGAPVSLAAAERTSEIDPGLVGRVPGTDYGASYDAVTGTTHNTAILGILGIGKTTLASELTWRTLAEGARVVVIDITNEYARHFREVFGPDDQTELEAELNSAVANRRNSPDYVDGSAGNLALFRSVVRERLTSFFSGKERMLILNPARLAVTRDDGGFADNRGNARRLVSLNPAEVTAIIAREILAQVSDEITDRLRACLVLEEAHSLAPEWNSTAHDGEKRAATATARAIMQGRKFGFGSIVVTQRTATVTKSILNQCNTVFALRVYDQTGTEFLGNLIGDDHARLLANLRDRHAIVYGKASSCASPLLIELNDSSKLDEWRDEIRAKLANTQPQP